VWWRVCAYNTALTASFSVMAVMGCRLVHVSHWPASKELSIIDKYADPASGVYAPLQREGRFPDSRPKGRVIETEHFVPSSTAGLQALENFLPKGAKDMRIKVLTLCASCDYLHRQAHVNLFVWQPVL
jgi:hypothetical protein